MKKLLTALAVTGLLTACGRGEQAQRSEAPPGEPVAMDVSRVVSKKLDIILKIPGEIRPYQDVPLYPKIPGFIEWIGVDRGSVVKPGQLLVKLVAPELTAQCNEAQAKARAVQQQLREAERRLESAKAQQRESEARLAADDVTCRRLKEAARTPGIIALNEVHIAEEAVNADRAAVQSKAHVVEAVKAEIHSLREREAAAVQALKNIEDIRQYLYIRAPFHGVITERNQHAGSFVYPPSGNQYPPMLRLKENSVLRIVCYVPEEATAGVFQDSKINFTVAAYPGKVFTGQVARIARSLDIPSLTMPVELNYFNPKWTLNPGMFPEIQWPMRRTYPTLFVPVTAVVESLKAPFVLKVKDGVLEKVEVRRGQTMGDLVEVFGNIREGDFVAVKGTDEYPTGTRITPIASSAPSGSSPDGL
jgi:RND family efflux transporter MFP subunit